MQQRGNFRRLFVACLFSVGLHGVLLGLIPASGWVGEDAFNVSTLPTRRLELILLPGELSSGNLQHAPSERGDAGDTTQREQEGVSIVSGESGVPWGEEMGPPFPPPLPTYMPSEHLDRQPMALSELDTRFPELEGTVGAGRMIFSLLIDEKGNVEEAINEYSSLKSDFVAPVQLALERMRFSPGIKAELPVKSRIRIEVNLSYSIH